LQINKIWSIFLATLIVAALPFTLNLSYSSAQSSPNLYTISGLVYDPYGNPVSGTLVYNINSTGFTYGQGAYSNGSGYYTMAVPSGTYRIVARSGSMSYSEVNIAVNGNITKNISLVTCFTVSGYVLDQNGRGISGVSTNIYNSTWSVPVANTDYSGHYSVIVPAGTYSFGLWPPQNSNYVSYSESAFVVSADMIKNVTMGLASCKLSGYLSDTAGAVISSASVWLKNSTGVTFSSGTTSNNIGYYYVNAPAGTYTLYVRPSTSTTSTYNENIILSSDTVKNITVPLTATPTPIPQSSTPSTPNPTPKPTNPTPTPQHTSTLTLTCTGTTTNSLFSVQINGNLATNGAGLLAKTIDITYSANNTNSWHNITTTTTGSDGNYNAQWQPTSSGTYTIKAAFTGDSNNPSAIIQVNLAVLIPQITETTIENAFSVSSNVTVSQLSFNSESRELSFQISGPSGIGYVEVSIAKSLIADINDVQLLIDGTQTSYTSSSTAYSWQLHFTSHLSTHTVTLNLQEAQTQPETQLTTQAVYIVGVVAAVVVVAAAVLIVKKKQTP
jgi:hypothetical protein